MNNLVRRTLLLNVIVVLILFGGVNATIWHLKRPVAYVAEVIAEPDYEQLKQRNADMMAAAEHNLQLLQEWECKVREAEAAVDAHINKCSFDTDKWGTRCTNKRYGVCRYCKRNACEQHWGLEQHSCSDTSNKKWQQLQTEVTHWRGKYNDLVTEWNAGVQRYDDLQKKFQDLVRKWNAGVQRYDDLQKKFQDLVRKWNAGETSTNHKCKTTSSGASYGTREAQWRAIFSYETNKEKKYHSQQQVIHILGKPNTMRRKLYPRGDEEWYYKEGTVTFDREGKAKQHTWTLRN